MATVLFVDDDPGVRDLATFVLEEAGHVVVAATGLRAALSRLNAATTPDALLTDQIMPDGAGTTLIAAARARHPALPCLLLTGGAEAPPGTATLHKPFRARELLAALSDILS